MATGYWSASRIDCANYCRMKYYLKYVERYTPLRLSAYAKGSLLHELIENFWGRLGTEEEAGKRSSTKKYFDAETFAKYAQGKWTSIIISSKNSKNPINWNYEDERWFIKSDLKNICIPLYSNLVEQGPPIFSELSFDFSLFGKRFKGRVDEIRLSEEGKVIIRDFKSGRPWIGDMKLNYDTQLTFYNAAVCSVCYADEEFAKKLGIGEERKKFMGNPYFVNPDFRQEFFMIEALKTNDSSKRSKSAPTLIYSTNRKDEHFLELLTMINGTQKAISSGNVYPERGRKCDSCDMKHVCEKKLDEVNRGFAEDKKGQILLDFATPIYARKIETKEESPPQEQLKMKLRKKRSAKNHK
ncbi:MAG TPA: PD-(D/E)XK nuclease family protein [Candidatus Nanoarchaeia archaeon]|nr:PD-(D/E)XK nuclease family protein [Candidatus Nanoarchaeia archaeon]